MRQPRVGGHAGIVDFARQPALVRQSLRRNGPALEAQLDDVESVLFVWEEGGELLGFCGARVDRAPPILEERRRAEIADLMVEPPARRRGGGRALVEAATGWAREQGVERIEVRVVAGNVEGQAFWRALGYADFVDVLHRRL